MTIPPSLEGALDGASDRSLHEQIYLRLRDAVLAGTLATGARVPSTRALALELGVARGTVDLAFARLAGEGYFVASGAAGTHVAALRVPREGATPRRGAARGAPSFGAEPADRLKPFCLGMPAVDAFPAEAWSRLVARASRRLRVADLAQAPAEGDPALRDAVAGHLAVSRGIACSRDRVWITAGFQGALGLLTRALLRPGERVVVEDPGYVFAREAVRAAGLRPVPARVDDEGLDLDATAGPAVTAVIVTPNHQMPLGVPLSLRRRLALLETARRTGAWIVEDDYDGEFHYDARPAPALKSLDRDERVVYVGTFSKTMFPALRLGFVVVPEPAVARVRAIAELLQPASSLGPQRALAAFIADGQFARHLRRVRLLYGERRTALRRALEETPGRLWRVSAGAGGLHLIAWLEGGVADERAAAEARARGLAPGVLSRFGVSAATRRQSALLLAFPNLPARRARDAVARLADAVAATRGSRPRRGR